MPWKACELMSLRWELVTLARQPDADRSALARRYGISRKTLYKWLARSREDDPSAMEDRSRRPTHSPGKTPDEMEQQALSVRQRHPAWGPRKIRAVLLRQGPPGRVPSPSTIGRILHRHELIGEQAGEAARHYQRFEHPSPNDLWQMDFKGDFALSGGGRCYPLTVLDDHSRYALLLRACPDQRRTTVLSHLMSVFQRYGLPRRMLMDNGAPWGVSHAPECYTRLEVELLGLDVAVTHGRPYHPQTQGKEERFHRTLKVELLQQRQLANQAEAQQAFDPWRHVYNHERPHDALGLATPASRYTPSLRSLPAVLAAPEYHDSDVVRSLNPVGQLSFKGASYKLSEAFGRRRIALRATAIDGVWDAYFGRFLIAVLDQRDGSTRMVRK